MTREEAIEKARFNRLTQEALEALYKEGESAGLRAAKELTEYEKLVDAIRDAPLTWLPALLIATVNACVGKNFFLEGGLLSVVKRAMERAGKMQLPVLERECATSALAPKKRKR